MGTFNCTKIAAVRAQRERATDEFVVRAEALRDSSRRVLVFDRILASFGDRSQVLSLPIATLSFGSTLPLIRA